MSPSPESRKIEATMSFLDVFLNTSEDQPRIILAIGYAQYIHVSDLLNDKEWRDKLKDHGATEADICSLEQKLRDNGLLASFTPEEANALLGQDDQAERIARAVAALPGSATNNLRDFLRAAGQEWDIGLIHRIQSSRIWAGTARPPDLLREITIDSLNLSHRARNVLRQLGLHTFADLQERTPKASELLAQSRCGPHTLEKIILVLRAIGIVIVNDSKYPF